MIPKWKIMVGSIAFALSLLVFFLANTNDKLTPDQLGYQPLKNENCNDLDSSSHLLGRNLMFRRMQPFIVLGIAVSCVPSVRPAEACFVRSPLPVQVWLDHIHVDIIEQVAVKTYHCTFKNSNH